MSIAYMISGWLSCEMVNLLVGNCERERVTTSRVYLENKFIKLYSLTVI